MIESPEKSSPEKTDKDKSIDFFMPRALEEKENESSPRIPSEE